MNDKKKYFIEHLNIIQDLISENVPKLEISRILDVKYATLDKYLKKFGIVYHGNQSRKGINRFSERTPLDEILCENGKFISASKLRKRLIEEHIKEEKCEMCHNSEWMGQKIPLELHHKNNNHYDNRLDNLQILCSNCHSLVHGYSNNVKKKSKLNKKILVKENNVENKKVRYCVKCGKELRNGQKKYCSLKCFNDNKSKKPSCEKLEDVLYKTNYNLSATGRFFNVSDNAVRKWVKSYGIIFKK